MLLHDLRAPLPAGPLLDQLEPLRLVEAARRVEAAEGPQLDLPAALPVAEPHRRVEQLATDAWPRTPSSTMNQRRWAMPGPRSSPSIATMPTIRSPCIARQTELPGLPRRPVNSAWPLATIASNGWPNPTVRA